jgi:FMN-dependent oxidoreductase (nitrilotriacetate monooxygenase family)
MTSSKKLTIGVALVTSWLSGNGWKRSDSQVESMFTLAPYLELAKRSEQSYLDFVFRPDALYLSQQDASLEANACSLEPFTLLSAIAAHTQKIGLVCTASTTFLPPFQIARQLQSLHWISQGRAGWNVVTALGGQQNFGQQEMPSQKTRYEKAEQCLNAVQALWRSFPNQALIMDKKTGQFANVKAIQAANYYQSLIKTSGPLNTPAPPFGCPPIFQAGASSTGRNFAAKYANAIFAATPDIEAGVELRSDLRKRAVQHGRNANEIKVLPGLSLFLAETREEASKLYQFTHKDYPLQKRFSYIKEAIGLDLNNLPLEQRITGDDLPPISNKVRSRTHSHLMRRYIERESPTVEQLLQRPEVMGSSHWQVIGTPDDVVQSISERVQMGAADGFIAVFGGAQQSIDLFFNEVMPTLVKQGWFRDHYQQSTLAGHLALSSTRC